MSALLSQSLGPIPSSNIARNTKFHEWRPFWLSDNKIENGGWFTHVFWKKNHFLFNYLLRYKLTPVVLWKLKPEMGKFHIKGNFSRFLGNFTEDHKYFLQESLVTFAIYSTSAGPTTPAKIWTKAKLAWLRGFLDHIGQFHKFTHPPILTWGVLWWKTQNTKRPRASRFSSGGSLDSASICVDWVGFRKQP